MGATRRWSTDTHVHYYFLNLMVFDLIQAIGEPSMSVPLLQSSDNLSGGMFNIAWIDAAVGLHFVSRLLNKFDLDLQEIYPGTICTVQGIIILEIEPESANLPQSSQVPSNMWAIRGQLSGESDNII